MRKQAFNGSTPYVPYNMAVTRLSFSWFCSLTDKTLFEAIKKARELRINITLLSVRTVHADGLVSSKSRTTWGTVITRFMSFLSIYHLTLQRRHNERDSLSNHRRLDYLLNRLLRHRSKIASTLRVTGLCEGNSPVTVGFPAQRASNAENASIWWRLHDTLWTRHHFADDIFKFIF